VDDITTLLHSMVMAMNRHINVYSRFSFYIASEKSVSLIGIASEDVQTPVVVPILFLNPFSLSIFFNTEAALFKGMVNDDDRLTRKEKGAGFCATRGVCEEIATTEQDAPFPPSHYASN